MIRVLQVVTHMNRGGLETMLMNYYRNIDREKVQVDFLVHRQEVAAYDDEILSMGGKIYRLPMLNPFSGSYRKALRHFFDSYPEYKVIHVHQDCMSSIILKEAKKHGVKMRIAHSHSTNQDKNVKYIFKLFYKRFISKYSTELMACSKDAGKWMFGDASFLVLKNAIDSKVYVFDKRKYIKMRSDLDIANEETLIGHIGRFSYPKNHSFLIDIFKELSLSISAKLILVGGGPLKSEIEKKVKTLGLEDKVFFMGVRNDIPDLLQAIDIFVFPSNYEGLPVTMVEAQAAGVPCVISDKVPDECIITEGLVTIKELSVSAKEWAKHIIEQTEIKRRNTKEEIKKHGFDIVENAKWLEKFYLDKLEEREK